MTRPILILGGPTGSGKSRVALEVAQSFPSEIINADSRQVYLDLVIGTSIPSTEERNRVPHHLFGFLHPSATFSAADYERLALPLVEQILQRNRIPIIVGGTGFYIKALLKGVWTVASRDDRFRQRLKAIQEKKGRPFLYKMLQRLDPVSASKISINDVYRVVRTLEIYFLSGIRKFELAEQTDRFPALKFYLNPDRSELQKAIRNRSEAMLHAGWIDEVKRLMQQYPDFEHMPAAESVGYREIVQFLRGETDLEKCSQAIVQRTMQYAKRQLTWFRNQDRFVPLPPREELYKLLDSVLQ